MRLSTTTFLLSLPLLTLSAPDLPIGIASPHHHHSRDIIQKRAVNVTDDVINQVINVMQKISTMSWENGTMAEALIQFSYPNFSVFNFSISPDLQGILNETNPSPSIPSSISTIGTTTLQNRPLCFATHCGNASTSQRYYGLLTDGAAGDPASLGISVLLAGLDEANQGKNVSGTSYGKAVSDEVQYLLQVVPRTPSGAISHRADQAQLWSDSVFMVPPFLAYYGMYTANQTLLQAAYDQCRLYREGLQDSTTKLWRHIQLGNGTSDPGLWATGNAWAAAGMMRVYATIQQSQFNDAMQSQKSDLQSWTEEIITAASGMTSKDGLVHNYMDNSSTFEDTAGSAMLASTAYRLSTLGLNSDHIKFALQIHSTIAKKYINGTGYLVNTVDPLSFAQQATTSGSPEGQSFVVMMEGAYREYIAQGGKDTTSWGTRRVASGGAGLLVLLLTLIMAVDGWL